MKFIAILVAFILAAPFASAHEFWFEPLKYHLKSGEKIEARAINGQHFEGREFSYSPREYQRSGVVAGDVTTELDGKSGQRPAVSVKPAGDGLNIVYHSSSALKVVYPGMEKFESFLRGKRLEWALDVHKEKGYPTKNIGEGYFRFVKALVAVGDGAGSDRAVGMSYELVAHTNPYTDRGDMIFSLFYRGKPEANSPVFVFHRSGGKVTEIRLRTDANGRVTVPGMPGEFMVNAVRIMEASQTMKDRFDVNWQTLWAATVYQISG